MLEELPGTLEKQNSLVLERYFIAPKIFGVSLPCLVGQEIEIN
jgi:hypothetical protein